jgi:hypothetical protein
MRAHGVSNFADQTENGPAPGNARVNKHSPVFHAAEQSCHTASAALAAIKPVKSRASQLRIAQCMRAHRVKNFPDPLPGGGFTIPSTINTSSPTFRSASLACQQ